MFVNENQVYLRHVNGVSDLIERDGKGSKRKNHSSLYFLTGITIPVQYLCGRFPNGCTVFSFTIALCIISKYSNINNRKYNLWEMIDQHKGHTKRVV